MSYVVHYPTGVKHKYPQKVKTTRLRPSNIALASLGIVVAVLVLFNVPTLRNVILPGDPEVTEQAAKTMIDQLREGETFADCFADFCREVIAAGQKNQN